MRSRPLARWAAPAGLAAALAAGALLVPQLASADPELPPTTAAELLVRLAEADAQEFSGTVVQTSDLGLPELPTGNGSGTDLTTLLAGSTTIRLWYGGADQARVAVLGSLSETDVVRDGRDVWVWQSQGNSATHYTLPERPEGESAEPVPAPSAVPTSPSPAEAAQWALDAIDPSTQVTLDGTASVAGRAAYELVLVPRDDASLVGEVRIAVDADTSLPLRVQVTARGASDPAFETGFTSVSFGPPSDDVFAFSPPPGAVVEDRSLDASPGDVAPSDPRRLAPPDAGMAAGVSPVVGEGWASVAVLPGVDLDAAQGATGDDELASTLLGAFMPVQGEYGSGRLLTTSLVSALALDDGRLLVGAVTVETLEAAALEVSGR